MATATRLSQFVQTVVATLTPEQTQVALPTGTRMLLPTSTRTPTLGAASTNEFLFPTAERTATPGVSVTDVSMTPTPLSQEDIAKTATSVAVLVQTVLATLTPKQTQVALPTGTRALWPTATGMPSLIATPTDEYLYPTVETSATRVVLASPTTSLQNDQSSIDTAVSTAWVPTAVESTPVPPVATPISTASPISTLRPTSDVAQDESSDSDTNDESRETNTPTVVVMIPTPTWTSGVPVPMTSVATPVLVPTETPTVAGMGGTIPQSGSGVGGTIPQSVRVTPTPLPTETWTPLPTETPVQVVIVPPTPTWTPLAKVAEVTNFRWFSNESLSGSISIEGVTLWLTSDKPLVDGDAGKLKVPQKALGATLELSFSEPVSDLTVSVSDLHARNGEFLTSFSPSPALIGAPLAWDGTNVYPAGNPDPSSGDLVWHGDINSVSFRYMGNRGKIELWRVRFTVR